LACDEKQPDEKQISSEERTERLDFEPPKTSAIDPNEVSKGLQLLKAIVDEQNPSEKSNLVKISDRKAINEFIYIRDLFATVEVDSIEIYGNFKQQDLMTTRFPENTLLIVYFNYRRLARNQIKQLQDEWNANYKEAAGVFSKGGIVFELDRQICLYAINSCEEKSKELDRIDAVINTRLVSNSYNYERILTECGKVSFKRRLN